MTNQHVKLCCSSSVTREVSSRTVTAPKADENVEPQECSSLMQLQNGLGILEHSLVVLRKLNIILTFDLAIA